MDLVTYVVLERIREIKSKHMFNEEEQPIYWDKYNNKGGTEKRREEFYHKRYRISKALLRYKVKDSEQLETYEFKGNTQRVRLNSSSIIVVVVVVVVVVIVVVVVVVVVVVLAVVIIVVVVVVVVVVW